MDKTKLSKEFLGLNDIVKRLRAPNGCPWDRQQTDSSIKMYILEEAYEVLDAIERGTPDHICQELGDVLFQVLFFADLAEQKGQFGLIDVLEKIRDKMIRRHPHVFGEARVESPEEVSRNWLRIKESERGGNKKADSIMGNIPRSLPALLRAQRLTERASKFGVFEEDTREKWLKVENAFKEFGEALRGKKEEILDNKLGNLLFNLSDLARHLGLNAESALRSANQAFVESIPK